MRAPYPHVERPVMVPRPALIVSHVPVGPDGMLVWTMMITNAEREPWPGDIFIERWSELGLRIPSKVRTAKIAAVEAGATAPLGRLDDHTWKVVNDHLRAIIGLR